LILNGAGGGDRTLTTIRSRDFKSSVSVVGISFNYTT
jgi:hypothetical protein